MLNMWFEQGKELDATKYVQCRLKSESTDIKLAMLRTAVLAAGLSMLEKAPSVALLPSSVLIWQCMLPTYWSEIVIWRQVLRVQGRGQLSCWRNAQCMSTTFHTETHIVKFCLPILAFPCGWRFGNAAFTHFAPPYCNFLFEQGFASFCSVSLKFLYIYFGGISL